MTNLLIHILYTSLFPRLIYLRTYPVENVVSEVRADNDGIQGGQLVTQTEPGEAEARCSCSFPEC